MPRVPAKLAEVGIVSRMDIFVWKQLLKNLVLPPTGPVLIALVGLVLAASTRLRGVGLAFAAAGVLSLWALATPIVADALIRAVERFPALDRAHAVDAQAIVILAGGVRLEAPEYDGMPAPNATTLLRLVYGARVAHETGLPVLPAPAPASPPTARCRPRRRGPFCSAGLALCGLVDVFESLVFAIRL